MPEATIHKQSYPQFWEHEIGLSENGLIPAPSGDLLRSEYSNQCLLCFFVATPADARHYLGALGRCEYISQFLNLHRLNCLVKRRYVPRGNAKLASFFAARVIRAGVFQFDSRVVIHCTHCK